MTTTNHQMTSEQLADLSTLAAQLQAKAEANDDRDTAVMAYAVQRACSELEESRREFRAADATIHNLEQQLAAVVAENAVLHAQTPVAYSYRYAGCETCDGFQDWRWELSKEKPPEWMVETGKVTNLVELFERTEAPAAIANIQAQGVEMLLASLPSHYTARADIESFAAQLRQGAEQ